MAVLFAETARQRARDSGDRRALALASRRYDAAHEALRRSAR